MVKTIIPAFPKEKRVPGESSFPLLDVAEAFTNVVQGEGPYVGTPATFLRMKNCTLSCSWCDTTEVWKKGNKYTSHEILELFKEFGVIDKLKNWNHHLVVTGGSPLNQQKGLYFLFSLIRSSMYNVPFVEMENEAVLKPDTNTIAYVSHWNNSPKLSNSGMRKEVRYKPEVLKIMNSLTSSIFKFVITKEEDWDEIKRDFIETGLIDRSKIYIMPEGSTRAELQVKYSDLIDLANREGVRLTDRFQVTAFDKTVGV